MNQDGGIREEINYLHLMLNYEVYNLKSRKYIMDENPWHYHDEFEVCLVKAGKVVYKTATNEILLKQGDVVFVNANTIHSVAPVNPCNDLFMSVHFFGTSFLSGGRGNAIDTKYVYPIQNNSKIDMLVFEAGTDRAIKAAELIEKNILIKRFKEKYWEFDLRENICNLWKIILDSVDENAIENNMSITSNTRLKEAIAYIQEHYKEKISLKEIAEHIHISTRECDRMFTKYLKVSPISYLQAIRLEKATEMLLDFNKTILEIAQENGYSSSSSFGKVFKEKYRVTPKQYRNNLTK